MAQEGSMDRFNLGAYRRPISTRSAETQRWFDIGLNWCYGFNHEEAIKCFKKALESDPRCAMVHWGIAYAAGPFYNLTWKEHGDAEANSATRRCYPVGSPTPPSCRPDGVDRRSALHSSMPPSSSVCSWHTVVKALASHRTDRTLHIGILPGRPRGVGRSRIPSACRHRLTTWP